MRLSATYHKFGARCRLECHGITTRAFGVPSGPPSEPSRRGPLLETIIEGPPEGLQAFCHAPTVALTLSLPVREQVILVLLYRLRYLYFCALRRDVALSACLPVLFGGNRDQLDVFFVLELNFR